MKTYKMRHMFLAVTAFGLVLSGLVKAESPLFVDATPQDNFKLYWLVRAKTAPVIDGRLDDAIWKRAKSLKDWGTTNYGRTRKGMGKDFIPSEIDMRAAWDDTYLYIAARCYHKLHPNDMLEFKREIANVSDAIYARECVEIHIDGNLDHATRFQSIVNPLREKMMIWFYDFGWGILKNVNYGLDADWDVAASIEKDHWILEVRYALSDIQVSPKVGTMFGINPCWFNWSDSRSGEGEKYWWQYTTWSTHDDSHHDPRLYGRFILVDDEPKNLVSGLKLAFDDLNEREVMVQTDKGYVVVKKGKMTLQPYDRQVRQEAKLARETWQRLNDLFVSGDATKSAYIKKNIVEPEAAALEAIEKELASGVALSRGRISEMRKSLGDISKKLDSSYWRVKQDIMLSGLTAKK